MTTTAQLRELTAVAVSGATMAGENVYSPRTWPTWKGSYPVILVQAASEDGESFGRNGPPAFTVTTTVRITARIQAPALPNDAGAVVVEDQLETMREQIKAAVINRPEIMSLLQHYPRFNSDLTVSSEGDVPIGELVLHIAMEYVQGPEDFYPVPAVPLQGMDVRIQEPDGTVVPGLEINFPT
jgi:hypothetical protein